MAILHLPVLDFRWEGTPDMQIVVRPQRICSGWFGQYWFLLHLTKEEEDALRLPLGYAVHRLTTESAYIYQLRDVSTENVYTIRVSGRGQSFVWEAVTLELGTNEDMDMPVTDNDLDRKLEFIKLKLHIGRGSDYVVDSEYTTRALFREFDEPRHGGWSLRDRLDHLLTYRAGNIIIGSNPGLSHGWNRFRQVYRGKVLPSPKASARKMRLERRVGGWFPSRDMIPIGSDAQHRAVMFGLDMENWLPKRHHTWYSEFNPDNADDPWSGSARLDKMRESTDLAGYTYKHMVWIDPCPKLLCHLSHARWRFLAILPMFGVFCHKTYTANVMQMYYMIGIRIPHTDLVDRPVKFPGLEKALQKGVDGSHKMGIALSHALNELKYQVSLREDPLCVNVEGVRLPKGHMIGPVGMSVDLCPWDVDFVTAVNQPPSWRVHSMVFNMFTELALGGEPQLLDLREEMKPVADRTPRKRRLDL